MKILKLKEYSDISFLENLFNVSIHKETRIRTHRNGESSHESDEDSLTVVGYDSVCLDGDQGAHEDEKHNVDERLYVIFELHFANPLDISALILLLEQLLK